MPLSTLRGPFWVGALGLALFVALACPARADVTWGEQFVPTGRPSVGGGGVPAGGGRNSQVDGQAGGGYSGAGGLGTPAPYGPGGAGSPTEGAGFGPTPGTPSSPTPTPGAGGGSGGGNGGAPGGSPLPGAAPGQPTAPPPLPAPPAPGGATRRGGEALADEDWTWWWRLNELHHLDLERRYRERNLDLERNPDLFIGARASSAVQPVDGGSRAVRESLVPLLESFTAHESGPVRAEAALALGRVAGDEVVGSLVPMIKDDDLQVRKAALLALGLSRESRAFPYLQHVLGDPASMDAERAFAAFGLGILADPRGAPALIAVVEESNRSLAVKGAALHALGFTGTSRARVFLQHFVLRPVHDDRLRALALVALANVGGEELPGVILGLLEDEDAQVRRSAALALGRLSYASRYREEAQELEHELIGGALADMEGRARHGLDGYLARVRAKADEEEKRLATERDRAVAALAGAAVDDADVMVRAFSMLALGRIGGDEANRGLLRARKEAKSNSLQAFAALGLGLSGDPEAIEELRHAMARGRADESTRAATALALGLAGDTGSATVLLRQLRTHGSPLTQDYTALALGLLDADAAKEPIRDELLSRSRPELKRRLGAAMALLGEREVVDAIGRQLDRGPALAGARGWVEALALFPDHRSLDVVIDLTLEKKVRDQLLASQLRALGMLGEKGPLPVADAFYREQNHLVRLHFLEEATRMLLDARGALEL